jgi:hypothetical protein
LEILGIMSDLSITLEALERARSQLSVSSYFDENLFRREQELIFQHGPRYLAHELAIPEIGDFYALPQEGEGRALVRARGGYRPSQPPQPSRERRMPINPDAIGAKSAPQPFEWTERDTLLYALGVGAGTKDLAFTTENSHDIEQQVLPTYAVIACPAWGAVGEVGSFNFGMLLHGSQQIRLHAPLPPSGKLNVSSEVADIQDKGEGKNAILVLKGTGTDPDTGELIAETVSTAVIRRSRSGQSWTGSRDLITPSRSMLPGSCAARATRPTRASLSRPLPGSR